MTINSNNYKELFTTLISGEERFVYIYNNNDLICVCYNRDISDLSSITLINKSKLSVVINKHCIITCDEILIH